MKPALKDIGLPAKPSTYILTEAGIRAIQRILFTPICPFCGSYQTQQVTDRFWMCVECVNHWQPAKRKAKA